MLRTEPRESHPQFSLLVRAASVGAIAFACTAVVGACSGSVDTETPPSDGGSGDAAGPVGSINVEFRLPSGSASAASYRLTGPNGYSLASMLDFQGSQAVGFLLGSIPAGTGYELSLTASGEDGGESCSGSTTFAVKANETTMITLDATCVGGPYVPSGYGSVDAWVAVPNGEALSVASLSLLGPAGVEADSPLQVSDAGGGGLHFGLKNIPVGSGHVLAVTGQTTTGLKCDASLSVDVSANATAEAKLNLICR
ncbi:MAG: hypothetical protein ACRENE_24150 [Polyangiaceae bacterium]